MSDAWPSSPSYWFGTAANWAIFLLAVVLLTWASGPGGWSAPALGAVILLLVASVAGQFVAAYRLIARQDEFIRGITAKRMVAAAGLAITLAVLCGLAQQFLGMPHVPMWLIYPLFWGAFGMVTPFIRTSHL